MEISPCRRCGAPTDLYDSETWEPLCDRCYDSMPPDERPDALVEFEILGK